MTQPQLLRENQVPHAYARMRVPLRLVPELPTRRVRLELGEYELFLAQDARELEEIQMLRFEVFNIELREGLASSHRLGRDSDVFDHFCEHLFVRYKPSKKIVGTYRMMTWEQAGAACAFYSASEFRLNEIPEHVLRESLEVGRACVHNEHRTGAVIRLLWKGLAQYAERHEKRYMFGCCSIPGTCADVADRWLEHMLLRNALSVDFAASVQPHCLALPAVDCAMHAWCDANELKAPKLLESYLRMGGTICGGPAIDRDFGVTDFLLFLDLKTMDPRVREAFLGI